MSDIPKAIAQALLDHWSSLRHGRDVPDRADIDPAAIRGQLPHLFMLDVLPEQAYRFRLAGTAIVARLGFDPTGKQVSDLIGGRHLAYMKNLFKLAIERRSALYACSAYRYPPKDYLRVHRVILPLTHGGTSIDILMVGQKFDEVGKGEGHDVLTILTDGVHQEERVDVLGAARDR